MRERNIKYDVLRIVAMFCIMFYHYTTRYNELYGHNNIRFMVPAEVATVSVSLFFIMVGYFSFYSLENTNGAFTYVKKRILRLTPTFWVACTITTLVLTISGFNNINFIQYLFNMLLVNRFVGIPFIYGAYWYMIILIVYIAFSFIYILSKPYNKLLILSYIVLTFSLGIVNIYLYTLPSLISFLLFQYVNKIIIGFILKKTESDTKNLYNYLMVICLLVGELFWVDLTMFICDLIAFLVFFFIEHLHINIEEMSSSKINKTILKISELSYFIYLIHQQVGYCIINYAERRGISTFYSISISILCILFMALCYSIIHTLIRKSETNTII